MRLFVAINLPAPLRARIHDESRPLRDAQLPVRWVSPENYHLTLKFLGEVHPDKIERIGSILDRIGREAPSFDLCLEGVGAFPTIRRPRVIWLGADPSPALRCLKQDVEWSLGVLGFERETRAFHPHLTLGRCQGDPGAGVFRGLDQLASGLCHKSSFRVETLDLMGSRLTRDGPRYTILSSSDLSAGR